MTELIQKGKSEITLKGSAEIVCEYLEYGVHSILFQRGIYPPDDFKHVENYGLTLLMSQNNQIKEFLQTTLSKLKEWLVERIVNKISLVITNVNSREVLERWDFNVEYEGNTKQEGGQKSDKPLKQIQNEIRDVLKQITSSVTYLPLLDCLCSFDLLIYTVNDIALPKEWGYTAPAHVKNAQYVKMRSFSTNIHKMETVVVYKHDD